MFMHLCIYDDESGLALGVFVCLPYMLPLVPSFLLTSSSIARLYLLLESQAMDSFIPPYSRILCYSWPPDLARRALLPIPEH